MILDPCVPLLLFLSEDLCQTVILGVHIYLVIWAALVLGKIQVPCSGAH